MFAEKLKKYEKVRRLKQTLCNLCSLYRRRFPRGSRHVQKIAVYRCVLGELRVESCDQNIPLTCSNGFSADFREYLGAWVLLMYGARINVIGTLPIPLNTPFAAKLPSCLP